MIFPSKRCLKLKTLIVFSYLISFQQVVLQFALVLLTYFKHSIRFFWNYTFLPSSTFAIFATFLANIPIKNAKLISNLILILPIRLNQFWEWVWGFLSLAVSITVSYCEITTSYEAVIAWNCTVITDLKYSVVTTWRVWL